MKSLKRCITCRWIPIIPSVVLFLMMPALIIVFWAKTRETTSEEPSLHPPQSQAKNNLHHDFLQHASANAVPPQQITFTNDKPGPAYDLDLFEAAQGVNFFTDDPRNQSTVNLDADRWENRLTEYKLDKVGVTDAIWMPVTGATETKTKGGFVYSAFFDNRPDPPHVLILGIVPNTTTTLFCRFHHQKENQPDSETRSEAIGLLPTTVVESRKVEAQWPYLMKFPFPVLAVFIKCPLIWDQAQWEKGRKLKIPASVSLYPDGESAWREQGTGNNLLIIKKEKRKSEALETRFDGPNKLTFCPRHVWQGFKDIVMLVEFIELHSLLGVSHFHFYGYTYSPQVDCILKNHYAKRLGNSTVTVELHNWELPITTQQGEYPPGPRDVAEAEPESAMNDCLYRSISSGVEFIANGDLDDAYIPRSHSGPNALLKFFEATVKAHPTAGAFEFGRPQFAREFHDDEAYLESLLITSPKGGGEIPLRTMRKTKLHLYADSWPKIAVVPERVYGMQTHWVYSFVRGYSPVIVDKQAASVHHYRFAGKGLAPSDWTTGVIDHHAHAFRKLLADRVERFLQLVPKECNVTRELWDSDKP